VLQDPSHTNTGAVRGTTPRRASSCETLPSSRQAPRQLCGRDSVDETSALQGTSPCYSGSSAKRHRGELRTVKPFS